MAKLKFKEVKKKNKEASIGKEKLNKNFVKNLYITKEDAAYKLKIRRLKRMAE